MAPLPLTPREEEIAALIVLGYDVEQISDELGIGTWGVKRHVKTIRAKVGAASMREIPSRLEDGDLDE